jgi:hypothetical protein
MARSQTSIAAVRSLPSECFLNTIGFIAAGLRLTSPDRLAREFAASDHFSSRVSQESPSSTTLSFCCARTYLINIGSAPVAHVYRFFSLLRGLLLYGARCGIFPEVVRNTGILRCQS